MTYPMQTCVALGVILLVTASSCVVKTDDLQPGAMGEKGEDGLPGPGIDSMCPGVGYLRGVDAEGQVICKESVDGLSGGNLIDDVTVAGNVGIGTTSPATALDVVGEWYDGLPNRRNYRWWL